MNYQLETPETVRGITFQVICSTVDTTAVHKDSFFVSRQKTPVIILALGDGNPKFFDLSGNGLEGKIIADIQSQSPAIRDLLS